DVSDYLGVHPDLGTLADMDKLIAEAGQRGISVVLDLVPNHTSDAHPWFIDARSGPGSAHRDYYVWADPVKGEGEAEGGRADNRLDAARAPARTPPAAHRRQHPHHLLARPPRPDRWEAPGREEVRGVLR